MGGHVPDLSEQPRVVFANPFAPEHRPDPYPIFNQVREYDPVHRAVDGTWVISRWAAGNAVLRDPRFSSNPAWLQGEAARAAANSPIRQVGTNVMMFLDPPDHTRLRGLVSKAFSPRVVEGLRSRVQELVDGLLDGAAERGRMDVVSDLAYPLPVSVICELLGVPGGDHEQFRVWSSDASRLLDGPDIEPEAQTRGVVAGMQLFQYFTDLVEERRARLGDDLLSRLIAAEEEGDRLTHAELITTATLLFVAGHETTMNLIGNAVLALLRHPDELARLRQQPELVRSAVEEVLRWDPVVQFTARIATEDVDVDGRTIGAGQQVVVIIGAANRDPEQFPDEPDRFDIGRQDNRHLTFSAGPHYCLGASLARIEAQTAIGTLVRRFPDLHLLTSSPTYRQHQVLRGVEALEVGFSPVPAAR
jgi:cytochrome P450